MIDRNLLLDNFETTATQLARKGVERATLETTRELLIQRKALVGKVDQCRAEMNKNSAAIGKLYKEGRSDEATEKKAAVADHASDPQFAGRGLPRRDHRYRQRYRSAGR